MSERDGYEPGVPCWVATIQPDPEAAAAFYGELFELQMVDYSAQYRLGHKRCAGVVEVVDVLAPGSLTPGAFNVDHGRRYSVPLPARTAATCD